MLANIAVESLKVRVHLGKLVEIAHHLLLLDFAFFGERQSVELQKNVVKDGHQKRLFIFCLIIIKSP